MKKKVCGEFPEFCYRVFEYEGYAKQFIDSGKFRLRCLGSCRNMKEEKLRDPTEGFGCTKEPGIITYYGFTQNLKEKPAIVREFGYQKHHADYGNKVYCFCTCLPEVNRSHMLENFGKYIVKINDPRKLAEDINDYFINTGQNFQIVGCKVIYNKGQKLDRELAGNERLDLSYKQKPESFSPDCEFRIVAIKFSELCKGECKFLDVDEQFEPECKFIEVNLDEPLNYLSLD